MHRVGRRPGQQFIQSRRRPAIDKLGEDVGKPILGADAVELARLCRPPNYAELGRFPQISC